MTSVLLASSQTHSLVNQETNLKTLIENYLNDVNKHEFDFFLSIIKQKQNNSDFISSLLIELKHIVNLLEPSKFESNLVNLIFCEIKWLQYSKSKNVLKLLFDFLSDLNSAYTSYIYKCFTMLIKMFLIVKTDDTIDHESMHLFAHDLIVNLVKIAPSTKSYLIKQIDSIYPYMIKETSIQEAYIKNVLKLADYFKDLRLNLLEICIQKILKIDVNSTREQILEAEINNDDQLMSENCLPNQEQGVRSMKHPLADRLDVKLLNFFEFIRKNSIDPVTGSLDWESCKSVYKDLLFTFDKYILFTYGSSHAQFIMFYICSFKYLLSEGFLDYLWKKFSSNTSCAITKQVCAYYIGSYLARAKYTSIQTCVATLQLMIKWIHSYIEKNGSNSNTLNFEVHRTFYALCQTVFYIIIFRNKQLFNDSEQNSKMIELVKSWRLNEIVSCKLNPLKYCLPTVRKKFARLTYINQIAYCYSIIDANNRSTIPVSGQSTLNMKMFFGGNQNNLANEANKQNINNNKNSLLDNPLDSFFPFDPYLLNRSRSYIQKFYIEFKDVYDETLDENETEDEEDDTDEEDEDEDNTLESGEESELEDEANNCSDVENKNKLMWDMMNDSDMENSMD